MDPSILSIRVRQFIHPLLFPSIYRSISWSIHRFRYLSVNPSIIHLPLIALSLHLSIYLSGYLCNRPPVSVYLSIDRSIHRFSIYRKVREPNREPRTEPHEPDITMEPHEARTEPKRNLHDLHEAQHEPVNHLFSSQRNTFKANSSQCIHGTLRSTDLFFWIC